MNKRCFQKISVNIITFIIVLAAGSFLSSFCSDYPSNRSCQDVLSSNRTGFKAVSMSGIVKQTATASNENRDIITEIIIKSETLAESEISEGIVDSETPSETEETPNPDMMEEILVEATEETNDTEDRTAAHPPETTDISEIPETPEIPEIPETPETPETAVIQEDTVNEDIIVTEAMARVRTLQQENSDIKGWLSIDDTLINYPLLQARDNNYYLKRDKDGAESFYGSIFMNPKSNLKYNSPSNVIIYGHNMKDKQMFGTLPNYKDIEYYRQHPLIKITTDEEETVYHVVYVFRTVYNPDSTDTFQYYLYPDLSDEDTFYEYVNNCKALAFYDTGITAEYGDQLISLVTCEYTEPNGRFVVVARRMVSP